MNPRFDWARPTYPRASNLKPRLDANQAARLLGRSNLSNQSNLVSTHGCAQTHMRAPPRAGAPVQPHIRLDRLDRLDAVNNGAGSNASNLNQRLDISREVGRG
jgi:hypothetical protein